MTSLTTMSTTEQGKSSSPGHHSISCEEISEQSDEGLPEEVVAANGIFDYFDSYAPWIDGVRCIVVATPDRRLVLAAPYEYGGSIAIEEPTEPGITLPEQHNPEDAGWKMALNGNVQWIIFFMMFVFVPVGVGLFLLGRLVYRQLGAR